MCRELGNKVVEDGKRDKGAQLHTTDTARKVLKGLMIPTLVVFGSCDITLTTIVGHEAAAELIPS